MSWRYTTTFAEKKHMKDIKKISLTKWIEILKYKTRIQFHFIAFKEEKKTIKISKNTKP